MLHAVYELWQDMTGKFKKKITFFRNFEILKFWNLEILDILDQRVNKGTDFTIFTDENFMAPIIVT